MVSNHGFARNQRLAPVSVLRNSSSSAVVFLQPAALGCRRSARTSFSDQTIPSSLRGELPHAQRYGPQSTSGAFTSPRAGSKLSSASPLIWPDPLLTAGICYVIIAS